MDSKGDHMVNEPQHQPPGASVDICFLVQDGDIVSGVFGCVSRASPVLPALMGVNPPVFSDLI